ncbi:MAG: hypothetical protein KatS3mg131_2386 [Candidatus Tectimicrobiota bacterium]|nr:MAG: hypothetical protein KatS3mg131_2386 [Candidatus Tectomicrobia bacterium]
MAEVFRHLDPAAITYMSLGSLRFSPELKKVVRVRFPKSSLMDGELVPGPDGKLRYFKPLRVEMYRKLAAWIRRYAPATPLYLCMESADVWQKGPGPCAPLQCRARAAHPRTPHARRSAAPLRCWRRAGVPRRGESPMAATLTPAMLELLRAPNLGYLATLMPDGSPQVTPVWVDTDGTHILVNTAEGRWKARNVRRDPRVALAVTDRSNPYRMLSVRGRVVKITSEGADAHIDQLAKKYLGQDRYPFRQPGEQRLLLQIQPERILAMGLETASA